MNEFTLIASEKKSILKSSQLEEFFTSFQLTHHLISEASCPLCNLDLANERVHYNRNGIVILDTKDKKGHKERIMVITKKHGVQHSKQILNEAILRLIIVGNKIFNSNFALLSDKFSSTKYHWHIVSSDLDKDAKDYQQIMETPFILITTEGEKQLEERKK